MAINLKKNKMKSKSLSTLKKKAWKLTSEIVRRMATDKDGYVHCVTCGKRMHWKESQAGHFIDGRNNSILFVRIGIHPQCYRCNVMLHGNKVEYYKFMLKRYGQKTIDFLIDLGKQILKISIIQYEDMIKDLKEELKILKGDDKGD